jgi:hypothetical protein
MDRRKDGKFVKAEVTAPGAGAPEGTITKEFIIEEKIIKRMKDRVCIVGCADSKRLVPWGEDMEFWGVNNLYGVELEGAHYDRWFEIHDITLGADGKYRRRDDLDFRGQKVDEYMKGLAAMTCPIIYMQKHWDAVPNSVAYPLDAILTIFGRYFTNTISYEIALAILMGYSEIVMYGVDMAVGSEYAHQRPSCEYFLGYAVGKGIKMTVPDEADLLKTRFLYAFEEPKRSAWNNKLKMVRKDMTKKMNQTQEQMKAAEVAFNQYVGALHAIGEMDQIWGDVYAERGK